MTIDDFISDGYTIFSYIPRDHFNDLYTYHPALKANVNPKCFELETEKEKDRRGSYTGKVLMVPYSTDTCWKQSHYDLFSILKLELSATQDYLVHTNLSLAFGEYKITEFRLYKVKYSEANIYFEAEIYWELLADSTVKVQSKWFWIPD